MSCLERLTQQLNFTHRLQTSLPQRALPAAGWVQAMVFREELMERFCIPRQDAAHPSKGFSPGSHTVVAAEPISLWNQQRVPIRLRPSQSQDWSNAE